MGSDNGVKIVDLWDFHETRLSRLEEERVEVASQLSEQIATLKSIKEDMHELKDSVKETNKFMETMASRFQDNVINDDNRLKVLENREHDKSRKSEFRRSTVYAILTSLGAALGILLEKILSH